MLMDAHVGEVGVKNGEKYAHVFYGRSHSKPWLDVRQNSSRDTHFPSYGRRPLPKPKPKKQYTSSKCLVKFFH